MYVAVRLIALRSKKLTEIATIMKEKRIWKAERRYKKIHYTRYQSNKMIRLISFKENYNFIHLKHKNVTFHLLYDIFVFVLSSQLY